MLTQVASANELKDFNVRKAEESDFWGQPRLIMWKRKEYPKLNHVDLGNIPEHAIQPITQLVSKDQSNIEPSDRVRNVQIWKDYLFLLVKVKASRKKGLMGNT